MAELPAGYSLDAPANSAALPAGYTLDGQSAPPSSPFSWMGLLKSAGTGLVHGAVSSASRMGAAAALEQGGGGSDFDQISKDFDPETANKVVEKNITGPLHTAGNGWERAAEAGGAAIGSNPVLAAATGPVGAFVSGAAASGAHDAFKGTAADIPAQFAAGLLAGGVTGLASRAGKGLYNAATAAPKPPPITQDQLFSRADNTFKGLYNSDVQLHPVVGENWALPMQASLLKRGLDEDTAPVVNKVLSKFVGRTDPLTPADILNTRSKLAELALQKDGQGAATSEAKAASDALEGFNQHILDPTAVPPQGVLKGDWNAFTKDYADATGDWGAARRMERWGGAMEDAQNSAAVANSGHNAGNYMRAGSKKFINGAAKAARGMNQDEIDAITKFARGNTTNNTLREGSNVLAGGGGVSAGIEALHGVATGNPLWMAAPFVGRMLRNSYNNRVSNEADAISQMLAQRSPLAQSMGITPTMPSAPKAPIYSWQKIAQAALGPQAVWAAGQ